MTSQSFLLLIGGKKLACNLSALKQSWLGKNDRFEECSQVCWR